MKKIFVSLVLIVVCFASLRASVILVPMDLKQKEHLKAYGITYMVLAKGIEAHWLLNYRGGSFAFPHQLAFEKECKTRNVTYEVLSDAQFAGIQREISNPEINMDDIKLEVAPKIAVYTPDVDTKGNKIQPWDDAVTMVLTYAEIPYEVVYDREVVNGKLALYDWLHLHHEDFTGQYGKFFRNYGHAPWYRENQKRAEELSKSLGFTKVSQCKLAVVKKIKDFVVGGGFMFAMCSATDSYDIALAAEGVDICAAMYDGDPADPGAQEKLDFSKTFAFKDFQLVKDPMEYEFSSIDNNYGRPSSPETDYFTLVRFFGKIRPNSCDVNAKPYAHCQGFYGSNNGFYEKKHQTRCFDARRKQTVQ